MASISSLRDESIAVRKGDLQLRHAATAVICFVTPSSTPYTSSLPTVGEHGRSDSCLPNGVSAPVSASIARIPTNTFSATLTASGWGGSGHKLRTKVQLSSLLIRCASALVLFTAGCASVPPRSSPSHGDIKADVSINDAGKVGSTLFPVPALTLVLASPMLPVNSAFICNTRLSNGTLHISGITLRANAWKYRIKSNESYRF